MGWENEWRCCQSNGNLALAGADAPRTGELPILLKAGNNRQVHGFSPYQFVSACCRTHSCQHLERFPKATAAPPPEQAGKWGTKMVAGPEFLSWGQQPATILSHLGENFLDRGKSKADRAVGNAIGQEQIVAHADRSTCIDNVRHIAFPILVGRRQDGILRPANDF